MSDVTLRVEGAAVHARIRSADPGPRVLFVHGAGAHQGWWDDVIRHLGTPMTAVTLDLTGHGLSAHRTGGYVPGQWAREVLAVADLVFGTDEPFTLVGHSLGGLVVLATAAIAGTRIERLVVVDAKLIPVTDENADVPRGGRGRPSRLFPDLARAVESFHLNPRDSTATDRVLRDVAVGSFLETESGWRLRGDHRVYQLFTARMIDGWVGELRAPLTLVGGASSENVRELNARYAADRSGETVAWGLVPDAHHHVLLDQPAALAGVIDATLSDRMPEGFTRVG